MRWRRPWTRNRGRIAATVGVGLVIGAVLVVGGAPAAPATQVSLTSGSAWLLSPDIGLATLIDGASEEVVARVRLPTSGPGMTLANQDSGLLVADEGTGTVTRIDGATYDRTGPVQVAAPGSALRLEPAGASTYVIDSTAGTASVVDSESLTTIRTIAMGSRPGPGQTLVTRDGRLWAVDGAGAGLSWYDTDGTTGRMPADAADQLTVADGRPAVVSVGQPQPSIGWLDDNGDREPWDCRVAAARPDGAQLLGAGDQARVFAAVPAAGTLLTTDESSDTCGTVLPIADPDTRFGALVQSGPYVFVPDLADGRITVVDTRQADRALTSFDLALPDHDVELLAKDGLVFYNDLNSERAGVLTFRDGQWVIGPSLQKYDPGDPGRDVVDPGTGAPQPVPPVVSTESAPGGADAPPQTDLATAGPTAAEPSGSDRPSDAPSTTVTRPPPTTPTSGATTRSSSVTTGFTPTSPTRTNSTTSGPSTTSSSTGPPPAPVIDQLTATSATIGVETTASLTATVRNARGATYRVSVESTGCSFRHDFDEGTVSDQAAGDGRLILTLPPPEWQCLGEQTLTLTMTGPGGAAEPKTIVLNLVSETGTTPDIRGVTCLPANPAAGESTSCTAVETTVGSRGQWVWSVTDTADQSAVGDPVQQNANEPFVVTMPRGGDFTVALTVTYRGIADDDSTDVRTSVSVPNLVGTGQGPALAILDAAGLAATVTPTPSHAPAGTVIGQGTAAGTIARFGDTVALTTSGGPNPTVHLVDEAPSGSWYSGANGITIDGLTWGDTTQDDKGHARMISGSELEDGSGQTCMLTHPRYEANGYIQGWISLPNPPIAGDHFRGKVGFVWATETQAGDATFVVDALLADGTHTQNLVTQADRMDDRTLRSFDVDLTPVVGARSLIFWVKAGASSAQDWACWIDPRIE